MQKSPGRGHSAHQYYLRPPAKSQCAPSHAGEGVCPKCATCDHLVEAEVQTAGWCQPGTLRGGSSFELSPFRARHVLTVVTKWFPHCKYKLPSA